MEPGLNQRWDLAQVEQLQQQRLGASVHLSERSLPPGSGSGSGSLLCGGVNNELAPPPLLIYSF